MTKPLVIAHRGASAREVENSLAAFRAAAGLGSDGVELDIHATADGALIVHHDEKIGGVHHIPYLTAKRVRELRLANGEPIDDPAKYQAYLKTVLPQPEHYAIVHGIEKEPDWIELKKADSLLKQ